jgi:hypothetical protein
MLTAREIELYVHGSSRGGQKVFFTFSDARRIGGELGIAWDGFDVEQFALGLNIELEHGQAAGDLDVTHDDPIPTAKIVLAHLNRIPDYYTRLVLMEHGARQTPDSTTL